MSATSTTPSLMARAAQRARHAGNSPAVHDLHARNETPGRSAPDVEHALSCLRWNLRFALPVPGVETQGPMYIPPGSTSVHVQVRTTHGEGSVLRAAASAMRSLDLRLVSLAPLDEISGDR